MSFTDFYFYSFDGGKTHNFFPSNLKLMLVQTTVSTDEYFLFKWKKLTFFNSYRIRLDCINRWNFKTFLYKMHNLQCISCSNLHMCYARTDDGQQLRTQKIFMAPLRAVVIGSRGMGNIWKKFLWDVKKVRWLVGCSQSRSDLSKKCA